MRDDEILAAARADAGLRELLREFDFDLERVADGPVERVRFPGDPTWEMIAGDASGGAFLRLADGAIVYVGSEGEGGLIAPNLRAALAAVVGLPSIHDALSQPNDDELVRYLVEADDEIRADRPSLDEDRIRVKNAFDLPQADLAALHRAAADERYRPISAEGDGYGSMAP
ncbi:hypothetical protein Val02_11690 [Virgisporangium aliadipatigenens]|uniref:Uncharacterized protein n=1 Tax=Virgisporangium aliadipatigenens TaxID=741659 RepID=A0A8J3YHG5_9ACTN|nr:hypothetical protein [Virgisporangium aliadipatigenens]GIJ44283.1 hypothetical protein Val02_11690 [Virgisporangium aliadipatigenens]